MNETTLQEPETSAPVQILTAADRCDLCGSRAYVQVFFEKGELKFCGHHAKKYDSKMAETAIDVLDETAFINA